MDRIDLHVEVTPVNYDDLSSKLQQENSASIRKRVLNARKIQLGRYQDCMDSIRCNAEMDSREIRKYCQLDNKSANLLKTAMNKLGLSARAYDRILKVARTIADLDNTISINDSHIAEAIQYRTLDRDNWR